MNKPNDSSKHKSEKRNVLWKLQKPMIIFYILVIYIFASFLWWSYLLVKNNNSLYRLQQSALQHESTISPERAVNNRLLLEQMEHDHKQQKYMIIGEGIVFFSLLGLAVWRIRKNFVREMKLARQQHNFMLSITHELKSPLASIKLGLETLLKRNLDQYQTRQILVNSVADTNRLQGLVEDILISAQFEDHSYEFGKTLLDFSALLESVINRMAETQGRNHKIITNIEKGLQLEGDRQSLVSLVSNLLDNAIKYTPTGGKIEIALYKKNKNLCLEISDTGIGISDDEKQEIFKKFYRIGYEDTRLTNGAGLGLYIVKEVLTGHQGSISVKNNSPKGSVFIATLPIE